MGDEREHWWQTDIGQVAVAVAIISASLGFTRGTALKSQGTVVPAGLASSVAEEPFVGDSTATGTQASPSDLNNYLALHGTWPGAASWLTVSGRVTSVRIGTGGVVRVTLVTPGSTPYVVTATLVEGGDEKLTATPRVGTAVTVTLEGRYLGTETLDSSTRHIISSATVTSTTKTDEPSS